MAGMLMRERVNSTANLAQDLRGRNIRSRDSILVQRLIDEETTSMRRAQAIADTESFKESYRNGQRVAAENSQAIVGLLEEVLEHLVADDAAAASACLSKAADYRNAKRETRRSNTTRSVSALYTEYLAHKDKDFHSWLATNGHRDVLEGLGVPAPVPVRRRTKATRPRSPRGNNPEDY